MQEIKETNAYRLHLKEKIVETAMAAFIHSGIRAVKMDDIARSLGISKRTLYEIYADKEELLYQGVTTFHFRKQQHLEEYANTHHAIDTVMEAYRMKVEILSQVNPLFYDDIMKYPQIEEYIKKEHERSRADFVKFMEKGAAEGMFREAVNYTLISHLFDAIGQYCVNNKLLHEFSIRELFVNFYLVMLRGCCTEKGINAIDQALVKIP